MLGKKYGLLLVGLLVLVVALVACQPETVETVKEVVVTRVVTETVETEGEVVEVTRVVTETETVTEEVVVEVTAVPEMGEQPVTLRWNFGTEPPTVDPSLATDTTSVDIAYNLYMGLTRPDPVTGELTPGLATDWSVSDDGLVWTFNMRDDVPWVHLDPATGEFAVVTDEDGNERYVNANDIVYGVKRTIDPATASDYAYVLYGIKNAAAVNGGEEGFTLDDVGVAAPNDYTVEFTLESPAAYFPSIAGMWVAYAQPQWLIESDQGYQWTEPNIINTYGPYGLEEWIHGGALSMVKNPLFPDADSVQIERIEGVMISEQSTAFAMYENDELDTAEVPLPEMDRVKTDPVLSEELFIAPQACTYYYGFNNQKAPMNDVRVRRAFSQAIDRQSLIDNVLKGEQIPATSFAPPGIFGAPEPGTVGLGYDPEAAKASLQEYLDENNMTVDDFNAMGVTLMHNTSESHAQIAAAIQQMWADVLGVEVNVENQEWAVYLETINADTPIEEAPHIFRLGWCADYADENNWVHEVFNSQEGANRLRRNCNDPNCGSATATEFDEITKQAQVESDPAVRAELYAQAEEILAVEETAYAPIYHYTFVRTTKPWLTRNYPSLGGNDFFNWSIDQAAQMGQ